MDGSFFDCLTTGDSEAGNHRGNANANCNGSNPATPPSSARENQVRMIEPPCSLRLQHDTRRSISDEGEDVACDHSSTGELKLRMGPVTHLEESDVRVEASTNNPSFSPNDSHLILARRNNCEGADERLSLDGDAKAEASTSKQNDHCKHDDIVCTGSNKSYQETSPKKRECFYNASSWNGIECGFKVWGSAASEDTREVATVNEDELEESGKRRIWVVHKGICSPVSWYEDTSSEDIKAAILCACDALADDSDGSSALTPPYGDPSGSPQQQGNSEYFLRQIGPLPDSVDVDSENLFMEVRELTLQIMSDDTSSAMNPFSLVAQKPYTVSKDHSPREGTDVDTSIPEPSTQKLILRVIQGRRIHFDDFNLLMDGCVYILEIKNLSTNERNMNISNSNTLQRFTGDRWRRLRVPIDPLLHIETQKSIQRMLRGSNLLKHTRYGHPHLRQFQLSGDRRRLLWYTSSKSKDASVLHLPAVYSIIIGQRSATFEGYRLPALQHLSFTLVYFSKGGKMSPLEASVEGSKVPKDAKTLDLTCKDEYEFDAWVTGLKAIIASNRGMRLSKNQLLSHSRRFMIAIANNKVNIQLTKMPEIKEPGQIGLDDCLNLPWHDSKDLKEKYFNLTHRMEAISSQLTTYDSNSGLPQTDISHIIGFGPVYASVFNEATEKDDDDMELHRMAELLRHVAELLTQARSGLCSFGSRTINENPCGRSHLPTPESDELDKIDASEESTKKTDYAVVPPQEVFSISSGGRIRTKTIDSDVSFEEAFQANRRRNSPLETMHNHVREGLLSFLRNAAVQTVEAQQLIVQAVATATASIVGADQDNSSSAVRSSKPHEIAQLKTITQILWRAEVDLENVEDMWTRRGRSRSTSFNLTAAVDSINQRLADEVSRWSNQIGSVFTDVLSRAELQFSSPYHNQTEFD